MTDMNRRAFVLLATSGVAVLALPDKLAAERAVAASTAAARIGLQALATLSPATLNALRILIADLPEAGSDLQARIAADHRAGRVVKVRGVSLSISETAWCLATAEAGGALS